jgi:hypothetical protein
VRHGVVVYGDCATPYAAPVHRHARLLFGINALVAWIGWGGIMVINIFDLVPSRTLGDPAFANLVGQSQPGFAGSIGRVYDSFSYFTNWSNLIVAITTTLLWLDPRRSGPLFTLLRNSGLLMITMTCVLYNLLLAPSARPESWHIVTNLLEHYLTPILTILIWTWTGPRGLFAWADTFRVFLIPIAYLAYTLTRGAVAEVYPYGFFNVVKYGYPPVLTLMGEVIVAGWFVALGFLWIERRRARALQPVPLRS